MAKKTIMIIGGYAPSLINFRGALLSALVHAGHDVVACAPERDEKTEERLRKMGVAYCPVPLNRTGINPVKDLVSLIRLQKLIKRVKPDVVLSYTIKPVIYGSLAARWAGVRSSYSMITGLGYAFSEGSLVNRIARSLYRLSLAGNRGVFFQNPDDRAMFQKLRLVNEKQKTWVVNGSGVDLDYFAQAPLPVHPPVFLLIGRLLKSKGIREYAEAARILKKKHPAAVFALLGSFDSNPEGLSQATVKAWEKEGVLDYWGETEDVRPFIEKANVYVLPSYGEGTPRTVLEAMAMGRPVVTADVSGCRETILQSKAIDYSVNAEPQGGSRDVAIVQGENGFLVPARSAPALAQAMEQLLMDPSLGAKMGQAGRIYAESRYDDRKVSEAILDAMGLNKCLVPGSL